MPVVSSQDRYEWIVTQQQYDEVIQPWAERKAARDRLERRLFAACCAGTIVLGIVTLVLLLGWA